MEASTSPADDELEEGEEIAGAAAVQPSEWSLVDVEARLKGSSSVDLMSVTDLIGAEVATNLAAGQENRWGIKSNGSRIQRGMVDIFTLSDLSRLWGNTVRHFSGRLFAGQGATPSAVMANTTASLTLELGPGVHEEPVTIEGGRLVYPTIFAGQYLLRLLQDEPESASDVDEKLRPFAGRSVGAYAKLAAYMATNDVHSKLILPQPDSGSQRFVLAEFTVERAKFESDLLNRRPAVVTKPEEIVGIVDSSSFSGDTFVLLQDKPSREITATYDPDLKSQLHDLWGRRVLATYDVRQPERDWVPGARRMRRSYHLRRVEDYGAAVPPGR